MVAKDIFDRFGLSDVAVRCRGPVRIDVTNIRRIEFRIGETVFHGTTGAFPTGSRLRHVVGVAAHSISHYFTKDVRPPVHRALEDAGVDPARVDYINAHGTSTPPNDRIETLAIKRLFGEHARQLAVSSTKSMTGHLLGAAGGLEAGITVLALRDQVLPPTINQEHPDPECDLDYVPNQARACEIQYAMSNSFGFGGTNASLLFKRGTDREGA